LTRAAHPINKHAILESERQPVGLSSQMFLTRGGGERRLEASGLQENSRYAKIKKLTLQTVAIGLGFSAPAYGPERSGATRRWPRGPLEFR
jgi:hypothetical protein